MLCFLFIIGTPTFEAMVGQTVAHYSKLILEGQQTDFYNGVLELCQRFEREAEAIIIKVSFDIVYFKCLHG